MHSCIQPKDIIVFEHVYKCIHCARPHACSLILRIIPTIIFHYTYILKKKSKPQLITVNPKKIVGPTLLVSIFTNIFLHCLFTNYIAAPLTNVMRGRVACTYVYII